MIERRPPFGPDELPPDESAADLALSLRVGRELDSLAAEPFAAPGDDFTRRVMAAVAAEPVPQPAIVAGRALRAGRAGALALSFRDAWRVAVSSGRPFAVRAQALALVVVAVVALTSVASLGGLAAAGAVGLLDGDPQVPVELAPSPSPSPTMTPSPSPSPTPTPSPSPSVAPTLTLAPTETPEGTDDDRPERPDDTDEPETPDPGDDSSGSGSGSDDNSGPGSG